MSKREQHDYEVVVGNVGTVYSGRSVTKAKAEYADYVRLSKAGAPDGSAGRASGEDVTLFRDGEIWKEHVGFLSRSEQPQRRRRGLGDVDADTKDRPPGRRLAERCQVLRASRPFQL